MRELQHQNLAERLNLKKRCQRNQILSWLKEQLVLLDQVTKLRLRVKFKMSYKRKQWKILLQLQNQQEFKSDQTNTKKLKVKTVSWEDQQDFLGLKKNW